MAEAIPLSLKLACGGGIGLFIAFIGLKNLGLVTAHAATLVSMGPLTPELMIGLVGLLLILVLDQYRFKGAILIGILFSTLLAIGLGLVPWPRELLSAPPSLAPIAFQLDIGAALRWSMVASIFSFMFVDLLDSIGTIVACAQEARMMEEDGKIKPMGRVLSADALATTLGALLGTSTTTTYIESGAGIAAGARTGLASIATAVLFLVALFFTPIISMVPAYATAPALIVVGIYMLKHIREIPFDRVGDFAPAFLTLVLMPLTHSISIGFSFGFVSYLLLAALGGRGKQQPVILWVIGLLALVNLIVHGH